VQPRRRLTGRVAGAVAVLAALSGLTACGPAAKSVAALNYAGGKPTVLIENCADFKIDNLYVSDITTESARATWSAKGPDHPGPAQITMLEAPAGWTVTSQTLTSFDVNGKYAAQPFAHLADPATTVAFTVGQLKALGPGQVLISKGNNKSVAVSEKKFRKDAKAAC
jgi:hypothetical protein